MQAEARAMSQSAGLAPGGPQSSQWPAGSMGGPCEVAAGGCWPVHFCSSSVMWLVFSSSLWLSSTFKLL